MKYKGSCHCGEIEYEVEGEIKTAITCNCSYCEIKGLILTFVKDEQFSLLKGKDNLTSYKFNKKTIDHLFCKTCGVQSFSNAKNKEGVPMLAINIRTLKGVEMEKLTITKVDGKSW